MGRGRCFRGDERKERVLSAITTEYEAGDRLIETATGRFAEIAEIEPQEDLGFTVYFLRFDDGSEEAYADLDSLTNPPAFARA